MNFQDFKAALQGRPVFTGRDAVRLGPRQTMYNQLNNWRRKGRVVQLRRGVYILGQSDRKSTPGRLFLSGQLYAPSYVSLESALGLYGLIPEEVPATTCVTTRNTAAFRTELGDFSYQHVRREAFRGFRAEKDPAGLTYFLAEPEKAVADFIYLNLPCFERGDLEVFSESYRFQSLDALDSRKLTAHAALYGSGKLVDIVEGFCRFIREER